VSDPIRIEVANAAEARDLVRALAVGGLTGRLVHAGGRLEVEIRSVHEETRRLALDVAAALETWLEDRERDSVAVRVGDLRSTVRRRGAEEERSRPLAHATVGR